jgi:translation initiation factor IF-3
VSNNKFLRANQEIKAQKVRLVDENGTMIGVVGLVEAMRAAEIASLDLVEISPNDNPPVCKIMDYSKYRYESKKRLQESRKKQKVVSVKEMRFRPNIGSGDFEVKMRSIKKFLEEGDKVRISLMFRGREIAHNEIGMQLFERIKSSVEGLCKIEMEPKMEGKQIFMILAPSRNA